MARHLYFGLIGVLMILATCAVLLVRFGVNHNDTDLDPVFADLRRAYPLAYPVYLQREDCLDPESEGETAFNEEMGEFLIVIDPDAHGAEEILAHEYAHAMTWFDCTTDHDEVWGAAYSKCYRTVFE